MVAGEVSEADTLACCLPDDDPQADIDALGPLGMFELALQHVDRHRGAVDGDGVGGLGARGPGGIEQCPGQGIERLGHAKSFRVRE